MPKFQLSDRQKRFLCAFSQALLKRPAKTEWSYVTIPSDDRPIDLAVMISIGIPAVDDLNDIHKSDLIQFERNGIIAIIPGRKAFRVNAALIHQVAKS